jgi:ERCC4-type nuclease
VDTVVAATKPRSKVARLLVELGVEVRPVEEDEGNVERYVISPRLAVERRSASSFQRGIADKTLFTSAIYLREHFAIPVLIVEGQVNDTYGAFSPQALRGALTSMMIVYGVSVLASPDADETAALIAMMARQEQVGVPEISLTPKRKATDLADMQRRVVEMLPGSGMTVARELLQWFGSVQRIANAREVAFKDIRGIGGKKAAEIHRVLTAEYSSMDSERELEDAIEAEPELLFAQPVSLLARQHHIYSSGKERHIVDLVFWDEAANELLLVELKRTRLAWEHEEQLQRYLDHARESEMLRQRLDVGARIRGVLATYVASSYAPRNRESVSTVVVDRERAIEVLKRRRHQRLGLEE